MAADIAGMLEEFAERSRVEAAARSHFAIGSPAAATRKARYDRYHSYYAPIDGDQWPWDRSARPNKIHISANIVKAFVDTESRVLSILPRITNTPGSKDKPSRQHAEIVEDLYLRFLEMSNWEVWFADFNRTKSLYGLGILKPFWNNEEARPDVLVVEQPQNLLIGWGTSDYSEIDWTLYHYRVSPLVAKMRFPDIEITNPGGTKPLEVSRGLDHSDPLSQKGSVLGRAASGLVDTLASGLNSMQGNRTKTEYEDKQVEVWDYWYRKADGKVCNAMFVQGVLAKDIDHHDELPAIPYIIVENDHEPGSPEGMSTAELLIEIQLGLNRAISHFAQIVADNAGNAYQLNGENADSVPEGVVPKEDEIIAAGSGNSINPIQRAVNNFPFERLIETYWNTAHKITGYGPIMFGDMPGSQTSGRAAAVQIEAASNRLDPKRRRTYDGLKAMLLYWGFMLKKQNPKITVGQPVQASGDVTQEPQGIEQAKIGVGDYIKGFERWKIVAPEITPRDSIELGQHALNLMNGRLIDQAGAMDMIGIEEPEQVIALIEKDRSNARIFPENVQQFAAVLQLLQAIQAQQGQQQAMEDGARAEADRMANGQRATPAGMEDQNQGSQPGMPPPPGAPPPGGGIGAEFQPLVRQTPGGEAQSLSQIVLPREKF